MPDVIRSNEQKLPLFRQEKTGDAEFDALFLTTAYRTDVMDTMRANATLRKSIIALARAVPSFVSLNYGKNKIFLSLAKGTKKEAHEAARLLFAAAMDGLVSPFRNLPPDTPQEIRARRIDAFVPFLPLVTIVLVTFCGGSYDWPLASSEFPWKFVAAGTILLIIAHVALVLCVSEKGTVRIQGLTMAVLFFGFSAFNVMPTLIDEVNGLSPQEPTIETIEFAELYHFSPSKGKSHYYLLLASEPERLAFGRVKSAPSLEVSASIFYSLKNRHPQQHSFIKVSEVRGLLGLPFVTQAVPAEV